MCEMKQMCVFNMNIQRLFLKIKAFIVTPNSVNDFLNSFETVRYTTETRFHLMHVLALPTSYEKTAEYIYQILNHPTVQGGKQTEIRF